MSKEDACSTCGKLIESGSGATMYRNGEVSRRLCQNCDDEERIGNYLKTGEITSSLSLEASSCRFYLEENREGFDRLRQDVRLFYARYGESLCKIAREVEEINEAGRELEIAWWLPTLKPYYEKAKERGHQADGGDFKAMMWGCAGRVLLTLQDKEPVGKGSPYNGGHITFCYDETADHPRGGLQGLCASKQEALALIQAARDRKPEMRPNSDVKLAGL